MAMMVTTLSIQQLALFIRNKQLALDNSELIFGQNYDAVKNYMEERLGTSGYVMGIRGRINDKSVELLSKLDAGVLQGKVVIEMDVKDDDLLVFDAQKLDEAAEMLEFGLPEEMVHDQLEESQLDGPAQKPLEVLCTSKLRQTGNVRVTSLRQQISFEAEGITFIKTKGVQS